MREKIAGFIYHHYGGRGISLAGYNIADQIIKELCEEIEKVENPLRSEWGMTERQYGIYIGFKDCHQKILSLLRPKEKVVRSELCP